MKTLNKLSVAGIFLSMMFVLALITPGIVHAQYYSCTPNYQEKCSGDALYWYDSCGNQQNVAQYCLNGCNNNSCQNYYYNNNNCGYHAYQRCAGSNLYWYDSCGNPEDFIQNGCANNNNNNYNNVQDFLDFLIHRNICVDKPKQTEINDIRMSF